MVGTRASNRIRAAKEIKTEPEEEEIRDDAPRKRGNIEDQDRETTTGIHVNNESENRETQAGGTPKKRRRVVAEVEVKKEIKTESESEEWSEDEEEGEESGNSDPDYDAEDGSFSGDELCKRRNAAVNGNAGKEGLRWEFRSVPDTKPALWRFRPVRTPGPSLEASSSWTPLSVFQFFFSTSVVRKIVENTNKNAVVRKQGGVVKRWTPITVKDFYLFLTTVLYMSLVRLEDESDYWKTVWLYDLPFPRNSMGRDRYREIRWALSLCDPEEDEENESKKGTPEYDKLFKIQPFYSELVDACKANFQPHRNICVHERMVRKSRPLKCGYRLFALADSLTGYTWNLHIDTGKTEATRGQTAGYTAVKNLLPPLAIGSGFTLYTESLFSSPRLFTELLDKHIGCCGVINKRHSKFPQNAENDFSDPPSRGDIRWLRKDKLLFTKWVDTREVAMCSTVHEAFSGQVIRRSVKEGNGWRLKQFSCPDAVADFNRHMVVLKKSDLNFSYNLPCRIVDWHRFLFYHLLDLAVVNSFILLNELLKLKAEGKQLTEKEFREELCVEMHKFVRAVEPDVRDATSANAAPAALCLPLYYVEGDATLGRRKCKICRALTPVYCQKCLIPLCLTCNRNCYKEWHELEESEKD